MAHGGMRAALLLALALAGCSGDYPQHRRERMVDSCIANGGNPVECAEAAQITIPDEVAQCERHSPPWGTAECKAAR